MSVIAVTQYHVSFISFLADFYMMEIQFREADEIEYDPDVSYSSEAHVERTILSIVTEIKMAVNVMKTRLDQICREVARINDKIILCNEPIYTGRH